MQKYFSIKVLIFLCCCYFLTPVTAQTESQQISTTIISNLLNVEYEFYAAHTTLLSQEELLERLGANAYLMPEGFESLRGPLMVDFPTERWKGLFAKFRVDCGWIETYAIGIKDDDGSYQELRIIMIPEDNECRDFYVAYSEYKFGAHFSGEGEVITTSQYACLQTKKYLPSNTYGCHEYIVITNQPSDAMVINTCSTDEDCTEGENGPLVRLIFME